LQLLRSKVETKIFIHDVPKKYNNSWYNLSYSLAKCVLLIDDQCNDEHRVIGKFIIYQNWMLDYKYANVHRVRKWIESKNNQVW
jgi:hypothetical protein